MQPKKIEEYKYFRPIAWTIVILFATFVYTLSLKLQVITESIQASNTSIEERLQNLEEEVFPE